MSLLGSFIGGAAGAGAQIIGDQMKNDMLMRNQSEYAKMQSDLALERDKTIEEMKRANAERDRQTQSERITNAAKSAATAEADKKYGESIVGDASTLTPEQRSVMDQELPKVTGKKQALLDSYNTPRMMSKGAMATGDYGAAATFDKMADSGNYTLKPYERKYDSEGNLIAENDSPQKHTDKIEENRKKAEAVAAGRAPKMAKPFDTPAQVKLAKETDDYLKGQGYGQETLPSGIAPVKMDPSQKDVPDTSYNMKLRRFVSKAAEEAARAGLDPDSMPLGELVERANGKLSTMRDRAAAEAIAASEKAFGEDGKGKPPADALRKLYGNSVPLTSQEDFKRYVYEKSFNAQFDGLDKKASGSSSTKADSASPAKPAEAQGKPLGPNAGPPESESGHKDLQQRLNDEEWEIRHNRRAKLSPEVQAYKDREAERDAERTAANRADSVAANTRMKGLLSTPRYN